MLLSNLKLTKKMKIEQIKTENGTTIVTLDETGAFVNIDGRNIFLSAETIKAIVKLSKKSKKNKKKSK